MGRPPVEDGKAWTNGAQDEKASIVDNLDCSSTSHQKHHRPTEALGVSEVFSQSMKTSRNIMEAHLFLL